MPTITGLLSKHGPALTSEIAARLRRAGASAEAARQRLSRLPDGVLALRGISFPKRTRFLYLESQFGTGEYWEALIKAIKDTNPPYAAAIAAMEARGGMVASRHFAIISGAPVKQSRQVASNVVLERLSAIRVLNRMELTEQGECIVLRGFAGAGGESLHSLRARLLTEKVLLQALRQWAGRLNFASPKAMRIRDETPAPQFARNIEPVSTLANRVSNKNFGY
jgi:hypothetical protein